jgi:hypothetical protein
METLQHERQQNTDDFPDIPTEKPVSAKITSSTMLHERKCCNYCQEKHLNNTWLNITAAITSKKVTDCDGMLDWLWFSGFEILAL